MKNVPIVSIIDDDKAFQLSTRKVLEATDRVDHIIQFADGEEAIEYFINHKDDPLKLPDLIFLDLNMPYMDGWQFLDEFTRLTFKKKNIAIYICTSSASSFDKAKHIEYANLSGYLVKPLLRENMFYLLDLQLSN